MTDLKEEMAKKKPVYGFDNTLKKLKQGKLEKIYVASNFNGKDRLVRYAKGLGVEIIELNETNARIGVLCKRPHLISVLSFEK